MMTDDIKTEAQVTYKPYPAYKDSGVEWLGDIPEGWATVRFKSLFQIRKRIAGMLGFDILSITQRGIRVKDTKSGDGQLSMDYSKYQHVYVGDFAMNHMDLLTGFVDISGFNGVTSPDYRVFTLENNQASDSYYLYVLQFCYIAKIFFPLGQGAAHLGRWRLPTEAFNEFLAAFPPPDEQAKIAAFLDHETARIDALIEKQERLIELLEEKRQAVISHAVTKGLDPNAPMRPSGIDWLGDVPAHWEERRAKLLFEFVTSGSRGWAEYYTDEGYLFFRIANLTRDTIEPKLGSIQCVSPPSGREGERAQIRKKDLLISITADLGSVCVANQDITGGFVSQHVALCRPNSQVNSSRWLAYAILSGPSKEQLIGAGYGGTKIQLSLQDINDLWIPCPPKREQSEIASFLDRVLEKHAGLITKAQNAIDLLKERRTALISEAVTGKIDLRDWQPPEENAAVGA